MTDKAQLQFEINNQTISRHDTFQPAARSQDYLQAGFTFSEDWDGLAKTAIFSVLDQYGQAKRYYRVLDENDECTVPDDVLKTAGVFFVTCFGGSGELITTTNASVRVYESGYELPDDPSEEIYTEIIERLTQLQQEYDAVETAAQGYAQDASDAAQAAQEAAESIQSVPSGGVTGQVLAKASDDDYDYVWVDQGSSGSGDVTGVKIGVTVYEPDQDGVVDISGSIFSGAYADLTGKPDLHAVATSGDYEDLINTPTISTVGQTGDYEDLINAPVLAEVATSGSYDDLEDLPVFADVAITGDYEDLDNKPSLAAVATSGAYADLTGKPTLATVATTGSYKDLLEQPNLHIVAETGDYRDLENKPTLAAVATSGAYSDLSGTPSLHVVATSGNYNDLTNKPTISQAGHTGDYNDLTNKPSLATVATSGDYGDLVNKPTSMSNPYALTIILGSTTYTYDGSTGVTISIQDADNTAF